MPWQAGGDPDGLHGLLDGTVALTKENLQIPLGDQQFCENLYGLDHSFADGQPHGALGDPSQYGRLPDGEFPLMDQHSPIGATSKPRLWTGGKAAVPGRGRRAVRGLIHTAIIQRPVEPNPGVPRKSSGRRRRPAGEGKKIKKYVLGEKVLEANLYNASNPALSGNPKGE